MAKSPEVRNYLEGDARRAFLSKVESRMSAVRSVVARFRQEKHLSVLKKPIRTSGVILFARPNLLRWEIREPFRSILIVAGDRVAKFEVVHGSRKKLELGKRGDVIAMVMDRIRAWFLGRFDQDSRDYDIRVQAKPVPLIVFTPKDAALGKSLRSIELQLSPELDRVASVTILEKRGDRTHMQFDLVRRDDELPANLFSTADPAELDPKECKFPKVRRDDKKVDSGPIKAPSPSSPSPSSPSPSSPSRVK